jgi:hypothetical protein
MLNNADIGIDSTYQALDDILDDLSGSFHIAFALC